MSSIKKMDNLPRLPLEGHIDLTYRCNNHCLHCWLWTPDKSETKKAELTLSEIERIADEARALGCRYWGISGGEPLLRSDFPDIFNCLTRKTIGYCLNTNGTLITPQIARLLVRKGTKMIALYGATAELYDRVTRHPGGFEKAMQGFAYLKEAGAGFIVQLIPMQANWHQWDDMVALAQSLSPHWRIGASWLFLAGNRSLQTNREILAQRLLPEQFIKINPPNPAYNEITMDMVAGDSGEVLCDIPGNADDRLFAHCIAVRREFHVDPYGQMSWCPYIKDPEMRYDLRNGNFEEAWEKFIPACAEKIRGGEEWQNHCSSCEERKDCRWCAAYAFLETGQYSAPIPYLCEMTDAKVKYKRQWQAKHRRYFKVAGITWCVNSDLDFDTITFTDELNAFAVDIPGEDTVIITHEFTLPDLKDKDLGQELYNRPPWIISHKDGTWFYQGIIMSEDGSKKVNRVAVFNNDYSAGIIYSSQSDLESIIKYGWESLTLLPTDQIWLGPLLADRSAVMLHSAAAIVNGHGLVFVGHSEAGKSTTMEILKTANREKSLEAEILCDDRNVIRYWPDGWHVHGTWSHGTTPDVSPSSAPLQAILFLEQATINEIIPISDRKRIWSNLLATLIRPMVTAQWWNKELDILEKLINEVPCYIMKFDKSGAIVTEIENLIS